MKISELREILNEHERFFGDTDVCFELPSNADKLTEELKDWEDAKDTDITFLMDFKDFTRDSLNDLTLIFNVEEIESKRLYDWQ